MLIRITEDYELIENNIDQLIDISGYQNEYLSQKIGLKLSNFSLKRQKGNWSSEEIIQLISIIQNKKVQEYVDDVKMRVSINKGKFISSDEFEKQMGWK